MLNVTPIRRQYLKIKQRFPDTIVLFRLGDFYETFDDDARIASSELQITLTSREMGKGQRVPMAGIPYHALNNYLGKLVNRGYKVALCEQTTPPGKGLVERDVLRVVTRGTLVEPGLIDGKSNNYLASLVTEGDKAGLAYTDITTGEFAVTQLSLIQAQPELERLQPSEVLVTKSAQEAALPSNTTITRLEDNDFELEATTRTLMEHFAVTTLEGFGCATLSLAVRAAGAIVHYLQITQKTALEQLTSLSTYSTESFMTLDTQTRRNLELFETSRWRTASGSLLSVIDMTRTAAGGRLLKKWLGQPLFDIGELNRRQEAVCFFYENAMTRRRLVTLLRDISDLERLTNRVKANLATPRELAALGAGLNVVPEIKDLIENAPGDWLHAQLKPLPEVVDLIKNAIAEEPPAQVSDGGAIREGFDTGLDALHAGRKEARQYLTNLEQQERERTGIKSLKVGYNQVFGYYIEISKTNLKSAPENYIRKQTLTDAERFYTPELKEYESIISGADERIKELEQELFHRVCRQACNYGEWILATARTLASLDVFASLAEIAARYNYTRPHLTEEDTIDIRGGRHPVVERNSTGELFVANDVFLSNQTQQVLVITGPNMSGKSTYIRQVALIVLLAQIGSFVPADSATIGVVDRIFTRIGAQEDLSAAQSTFMVEMVETASILNNATSRSLIILDEIGRGTSTYDGISIAWAVAEFIHNHPRLGAKTLFATHYHELVELARILPRVKNFNVAVAEDGDKVVFLRKVVPGGADRSYGIHVAKLAGLPKVVIHRAREVLDSLENNQHQGRGPKPKNRASTPSPEQLPLIRGPDLGEEILKIDVDSLSPLEAITKLYELKTKAKDSGNR